MIKQKSGIFLAPAQLGWRSSMAKRIRPIIVVCSLLLAVMTAWKAHASTSLIIGYLHSLESSEDSAHSHDDHSSDHGHAPLMGDHQNEVPHLGALPCN